MMSRDSCFFKSVVNVMLWRIGGVLMAYYIRGVPFNLLSSVH